MRILYLIFFLGFPFLSLGQESMEVKLVFGEAVNHSVIRISLDQSSYYEEMPFRQNVEFVFQTENMYKTGTVSVYDTLQKHLLIQLPVFIDPGLSQIKVKRFPEVYKDVGDVVEYTPSRTNLLNLGTWNNLAEAYEKYGKKGDGYVYLGGEGSNQLLKNDLLLMSRHPDNPFVLYYLLDELESNYARIEGERIKLFSQVLYGISDSLKSTNIWKRLQKDFSAFENDYYASRLNGKVPSFSIEGRDGTVYTQKSFVDQPYIIAFSATWCVPCKTHLPVLKDIYEKYQREGLEVLYVNLHDDKEAWEEMIVEFDMQWVNASELTKMSESKIAKSFNTFALPNYIVINRKGNMIYNDSQMNDMEFTKLEEYVRESVR